MNILMLSLDPNILRPDSNAGKRMFEYAGLVDTLSIVLFSAGGAKQERGNLAIYPTSRNKIISFFKGLWIGYRIVRKEKYDLITIQDPFALSFAAFPLAFLFRLPVQVQVHSTFFSPYWKESLKNTLYQLLARVFMPQATCIRAVSERIKRDLLNGLNVSESKVTVLPIFTDTAGIAHRTPSFDLRKKYVQFDFLVLIVSRLVKQKNIALAIDAMKELTQKHPRIGLVIVGEGPDRAELEHHVTRHTLRDNVIFEGWTDDVVSYYRGADVFLLTSNYEGWAMTIIEAMASGTAVVMTDVGCAGEVVRNGENGVVIPIGDQAALTAAIERLYLNPTERTRLSEAGRQTALALEPQTQEAYLARYRKGWEQCVLRHKGNV